MDITNNMDKDDTTDSKVGNIDSKYAVKDDNIDSKDAVKDDDIDSKDDNMDSDVDKGKDDNKESKYDNRERKDDNIDSKYDYMDSKYGNRERTDMAELVDKQTQTQRQDRCDDLCVKTSEGRQGQLEIKRSDISSNVLNIDKNLPEKNKNSTRLNANEMDKTKCGEKITAEMKLNLGGQDEEDTMKALMPPNDNNKDDIDVETNLTTRGKILRTVFANAAYLGVTLNLGMIGPSLLDMEGQTGGSTSQLSTVFMCRAILGLAASLMLGPLLDKLNRYLLTAIALFMDVIFIAVAPWCKRAELLIALLSPPEFFNSLIGMGTHLICISLWRSSAGPSLQALNLMATIGYTLSPLLIKPFLSTTTMPPAGHPSQQYHNGSHSFDALIYPTPEYLVPYKGIDGGNELVAQIFVNQTDNNTTNPGKTFEFHTNIQYAYLITALYDLIISIALFSLFFTSGHKVRLPESEKEENLEEKSTRSSRPGFVITISLLFFLFNMFYSGVEVGYAGLLMTFAVKYLGWSKEDGTNVTAVLQGSNAAVTALAVLIARFIRPEFLLAADIVLVTISMVTLSLAVNYHPAVLWACTAALGAGYATIMPTSFTWVNNFMAVTGKFSSAYWSGFFVGFMCIPAMTGYLFQQVHPMCLVYGTMGCGIGMLVAFIAINITVYKERKYNECQPAML